MKVILIMTRKYYKPDYIIGDICIDGKWWCDTLENRKLCIPIGIYQLFITKSQRFGKYLIEVDGVLDRTGIRIHAGNGVKDTEGCILPGINKQPGLLSDSTMCEEQLFNKVRVCNMAELIIYDIAKEDK